MGQNQGSPLGTGRATLLLDSVAIDFQLLVIQRIAKKL